MVSIFWRRPAVEARYIVPAFVLVLTGASCVLYVTLPEAVGQGVFITTASISLLAILIGPQMRGTNPAKFGFLPGAAALSFLVGLATRATPDAPWAANGRLPDIGSFTGYLLLALWLSQLSRSFSARDKYETWLDSLMVASGSSIIAWSIAIAPGLMGGSLSVDSLMLALYPVVDVVLVTLTAQLIFRIGTPITAMSWFLMSVTMLMVIDTAYTIVWVHHPGLSIPALTAWYLFAYAGIALGLCHPSVSQLDQDQAPVGPHRHARRRSNVALVFVLLPSVTCIVYPSHGLYDTVVRAVLIVIAIALVHARLEHALHAAKTADEHSKWQAQHDPLTGLGNRMRLAEQLPIALRQAALSGRSLWVFMLDLDSFKRINDTWGHGAGDETLKEVAHRLERHTSWAHLLARLGGDEFLICAQETDPPTLALRAQELRELFRYPVELSRAPNVVVTPSIGITKIEEGIQRSAEQVLHEADVALYEAKRHGKAKSVFYEGTVRDTDEFKSLLAHDLSMALRRQELVAAFQPIVAAVRPHPVRGWEALARWRHPEHGFVSPEVFISVAEEQGLLGEIFNRVLEEACTLLRQRNYSAQKGGAVEWVSINVSPAQILEADFVERLLEHVQRAAIPPSWLRLEVTETSIMPGDELARRRLDDLRQLGIGVFLDDFGAGFSGIGLLRQLQFDAVKIDRSFLVGPWSEASEAALRGVTNLARGLSVRSVIAEGIENPEGALMAERVGIELAQGWFFGGPRFIGNAKLREGS